MLSLLLGASAPKSFVVGRISGAAAARLVDLMNERRFMVGFLFFTYHASRFPPHTSQMMPVSRMAPTVRGSFSFCLSAISLRSLARPLGDTGMAPKLEVE